MNGLGNRWRAAAPLACFIVGVQLAVLGHGTLDAAELTPAELQFFESKVRPLLLKRCGECHSARVGKVRGGLARRMAEAGVRFIQVGSGYHWDHHNNIEKELPASAAKTDLPMAGLIQDLANRGLLEDTLVVCAGEFGRTPVAQIDRGAPGRDHNPHGYTVWPAGGGVRGGMSFGATDEFGYLAVENKVHMHDLHATILHLLGLDHERLTYRYAGRDFRLTDVYGRVVKEILA